MDFNYKNPIPIFEESDDEDSNIIIKRQYKILKSRKKENRTTS